MKHFLLILAVVVLVGCGKKEAEKLIADPIVEKAVRKELKKPEGELTEADLKKVTYLRLIDNQLTEVPKGLEKLTELKTLVLYQNQLTDLKGLEKLTELGVLWLNENQLTEMPKGLEKLTRLKVLNLMDNPDLTKAQITELQKALQKCEIKSNPKK